MTQMASATVVVCGANSGISYMVRLSVPPSSFSSPVSFSSNSFNKRKRLVLDDYRTNNGYKGRRGHGIVASGDVASPSIWDDWKPLNSSSTPSLSDILWPSAGCFSLSSSLYLSLEFLIKWNPKVVTKLGITLTCYA